MKHHQKKLASMEDDQARLFIMIMMYLSEESLDAIKKELTWTKIEDEADGYETIITYKERFNFALKLYEDQGNKKLDPEDIAMDFFRGLDNARYSTFKMDYINGLMSKAINPPQDLNKINLLANQWLKPKATGTGYASTFTTTLDKMDEGNKRGKGKGKQQQREKTTEDKQRGAMDSTKQEKPKRPVKCFICNGPHFAKECPERKQSADREENGNEEERHAHMTWEANMFMTYLEKQVNAIGYSGFRDMEVLLDNQADISIMRPEC
jgi:hypothetical protein